MSNTEGNNSGNNRDPRIIKDPTDLFFKISLVVVLAGLFITVVVVLLSGLSGAIVLVLSAISAMTILVLLDEVSHRRPTQ